MLYIMQIIMHKEKSHGTKDAFKEKESKNLIFSLLSR